MSKLECPNCGLNDKKENFDIVNLMTDKIKQSDRKGVPDFNVVIKTAICPECKVLFQFKRYRQKEEGFYGDRRNRIK